MSSSSTTSPPDGVDIIMTVLGMFYLLVIFVTYAFQYGKVYKTKSVSGITPSFFVLGNISSVTSYMNSLIFYFAVIHECFHIDVIVCINKMLGLYQIGFQYLCFMLFYILFVFYYRVTIPISHNYGSLSTSVVIAAERNTRGYIVHQFVILLIFNVTLISTIVGLLSRNDWHGDKDLIVTARILGIISTVTVLVQYIPQIYSLYKTKNAKNLSIPTYTLLSCGNLVSFIYLAAQSVSDFTTWLPYLVCFIVQASLSAQIIYYEKRRHQLNSSIQYDQDDSDTESVI